MTQTALASILNRMKTLTLTESQVAVIERYQHQHSIPEDAVIQKALDLLEQSERNHAILSSTNKTSTI
jgi:hypothetical protein